MRNTLWDLIPSIPWWVASKAIIHTSSKILSPSSSSSPFPLTTVLVSSISDHDDVLPSLFPSPAPNWPSSTYFIPDTQLLLPSESTWNTRSNISKPPLSRLKVDFLFLLSPLLLSSTIQSVYWRPSIDWPSDCIALKVSLSLPRLRWEWFCSPFLPLSPLFWLHQLSFDFTSYHSIPFFSFFPPLLEWP